ncbi:MAG: hypothetical protein LBO02_01425 [Holosporaceae bacterium]|jgi:cell pole-organizing protein PopZ|nr:hypothetical protein [Holosporaceae bacterium]
MVDKNSEMSLDEVLSSIKKMVIDDEPPVLDLTDMIKPDGSIVKIKAVDVENPDMSSFLKLVQENANSVSEIKRKKEEYLAQKLQEAPIISADVSSYPHEQKKIKNDDKSDKDDMVFDMLKKIAVPLIDKWIADNLSNIVKQEIAEDPTIKKWIIDNISDITKNVVEEKIHNLLQNYQAK